MREIDMIFNFGETFVEIKDIILEEILKYYDKEEQENIKNRIDNTLFIFYDDNKLKVRILEKEIFKYEETLLAELNEKLNLKDKNGKDLISSLKSWNNLFSQIINKDIYTEDEMKENYFNDIYTKIFKSLNFDLNYEDDLIEQVRNNEEYYKIVKKIYNEISIYKSKYDSFENYIKVKYKNIYDDSKIQTENETKYQKVYCKLFLKYLDSNNLLNKTDKERLKSDTDYCLFMYDCNKLFSDYEFKYGKSDYILDNNLSNAHPKECEDVINYLNECGIEKEKYYPLLENVRKYRELILDHYLLNTIGKEKEFKKILDWNEENILEANNISDFFDTKREEKLCLIEHLIQLDYLKYQDRTYDTVLQYSDKSKKNWEIIMKISPCNSFFINDNYFKTLVHEMIHVVDGPIKDIGYLNEILVEKFTLIIYEKIKVKLEKKYPFIDFDNKNNNCFYHNLFPIFDSIIGNNLTKYIECKGTATKTCTLYEYFDTENIEELTKLIDETYNKMLINNLNSSDLLKDTDLMNKVKILKDSIDNYILSNEKESNIKLR